MKKVPGTDNEYEYEYKRAQSPEEKREIVERLLKVWSISPMDDYRLGQLLENALGRRNIFNLEDYDFMDLIEIHYEDRIKDARK